MASDTPSSGAQPHTNHLREATSPYLLQHAHNPVDWHPWNEAAFAKARAEDKPIFLSIGYSACHWCHVMARESFENDAIAQMLNEHFVSIKVDREERPDVDDIYMSAVVLLTGQGGWPLSVFLTPELKPFYGGTYYPPLDLYGQPGFLRVIKSIADTWRRKRAEVIQSADSLTDYIRQQAAPPDGASGPVAMDLLYAALEQRRKTFDNAAGGWGGAPKFPSSPSVALLLRIHRRTGDDEALAMATRTLDRMARGGICDQIGGGFHRYAVDAEWLVPHFEKMLYDNAQLSHVYLEAYQATGDTSFRQIAEAVFAYVLRDMRDPGGAFYAAEDADSEGEEGKFYLWTFAELVDVLGPQDAALTARYYGVAEGGNFAAQDAFHHGKNILHRPTPHAQAAQKLEMAPGELAERIALCKRKLFDYRETRVRPGRDDKILTSWNGLMITALARGAQALDEPGYAQAAGKAARFILDTMRDGDTLLRTHRDGKSRLPGYLDDYAFLSNGCIDLYEATFELDWLETADNLAHAMIQRFWDEAAGSFCFTGDAHKHLITRTRPTFDGAEPSGNSVGALALLRLAHLTGRDDYRNKARRVLEVNAAHMRKAPHGFLNMLCAADFYLDTPKEIVIAGDPAAPATRALLRAVHGAFVPNRVIALRPPDAGPGIEQRVPLLQGRARVNGQPAAYVCENRTCKAPVTSAEALTQVLSQGVP
ncbi:MAG: thioredoxin domain-containing protein [Candidatus Hydrogenedentota bacterium]